MFFFFNDTATTEIYTLSLHDALPISRPARRRARDRRAAPAALHGDRDAHARLDLRENPRRPGGRGRAARRVRPARDRKSTRLNSSHANISYARFCLKKKKIDRDN